MPDNLLLPLPEPVVPGQRAFDLPVSESLVAFARRVASGELRPFSRDVLAQLLAPELLIRRKGGRR